MRLSGAGLRVLCLACLAAPFPALQLDVAAVSRARSCLCAHLPFTRQCTQATRRCSPFGYVVPKFANDSLYWM